MMFITYCANLNCPNPEKKLWTFAKNKLGELPTMYCSKKCEGEVKDKERYVERK